MKTHISFPQQSLSPAQPSTTVIALNMAQDNDGNPVPPQASPAFTRSTYEVPTGAGSDASDFVELQIFEQSNDKTERLDHSPHLTNEQPIFLSYSLKPPSNPSPPAYNNTNGHGRPHSYATRSVQEHNVRHAGTGNEAHEARPINWVHLAIGLVCVATNPAAVIWGSRSSGSIGNQLLPC
jgi:hypothetical protein